jgi:hypothetical protein
MSLTEQELREYLQQEASQASAPRLTLENLSRRIRHRRARIMTVAMASLAAVVAAVAIPVVGLASGTSPAAVPANIRPLPVTASVNGQGPSQNFTVTPGEHLTIMVEVTVPVDYRITRMWIGVSRGRFGASHAAPIGMQPILKQIRNALTPGRHVFQLSWMVPAELRPSTSLWLAAAWVGVAPEIKAGSPRRLAGAAVAGPIAKLQVSR